MAHPTTSSSSSPSTSGEFGRGKTIFVLAVVVGCFAVLWPKVFYPMFTASIYQTPDMDDQVCCDVISEKDTNAYKIMTEICTNIIRQDSKSDTGQGQMPDLKQQPQQSMKVRKPTALLCRSEILKTCGVDIIILLQENAAITKEYKESLSQLRSYNTSHCMKMNYGVDFGEIGLPKASKGPLSAPSHMRPERPFRTEMVHPALREKGRAIPTPTLPRRTIEREARPGPVPGVRPPVGGAGHVPSAPKGSGTMGIIMPMYTIGIVCFFVYTLMKILFKKPQEEGTPTAPVPPGKQPILKDYGMDPEHRKFVFAEEYTANSEKSLKDEFNKEDRELGVRRKSSNGKGRFHEDKRRLELETEATPPEEGEQSIIGEIDQTGGFQAEPSPSSANTLSDFDTTAILDASHPGIEKLSDSQRSALMAKYFADSAATSFSETFSDSDVLPSMEPQLSATIAPLSEETCPPPSGDVPLSTLSESEPPYPETDEVIEIPSASTDAAVSQFDQGELSDSFSEVKLDTTVSSLPPEVAVSEQTDAGLNESLNAVTQESPEASGVEMEPQTPVNEVQQEPLKIELPFTELDANKPTPNEMEVQTPVFTDPAKVDVEASLAATGPQQPEEKEAVSFETQEESSVEEIISTKPTSEACEPEIPVPVVGQATDVVEESTPLAEPSVPIPIEPVSTDSATVTSSEPPQVLSSISNDSSTPESTESLKTEFLAEPDIPQLEKQEELPPSEILADKMSSEDTPTPTKDTVVELTETALDKDTQVLSKPEEEPSQDPPSEATSTPVMNAPLSVSSREKSISQADLTSAALFFDTTIEIPDEVDAEQVTSTTETPKQEAVPQELKPSEPQVNGEGVQISIFPDASEEVKEYAESLANEILEDAKSTAIDSLSISLPQPSPPPPPADPEPIVPVDILITQPTPTSENDDFPSTDPFACVRINEAILRLDSNGTKATHSANHVMEVTPESLLTSGVVPEEVSSQSKVSSGFVEEPVESKEDAGRVSKAEGHVRGPVVTLAEEGRKNSEPILCQPSSDLQITPVEDIPGEQPLSPDGLGGYVTMADDANKPRLPTGFFKQLRTGVEITSFEEKEEDGEGQGQPRDNSELLVLDERETGCHRVMSMDSNDSVTTVKELDLKLEEVEADLDRAINDGKAGEGEEDVQEELRNEDETLVGESISESEVNKVDDSSVMAAEVETPAVIQEIPSATTEPPAVLENSLHEKVEKPTEAAAQVLPLATGISPTAAETYPVTGEIPTENSPTAAETPSEIPPVTVEIPLEAKISMADSNDTGLHEPNQGSNAGETPISVDSLTNTAHSCPEPSLLTRELSLEVEKTATEDKTLNMTDLTNEPKVAVDDVGNVGIVNADNACPCTEDSSSVASTPIQSDVVDILALDIQSTVEPPESTPELKETEIVPERASKSTGTFEMAPKEMKDYSADGLDVSQPKEESLIHSETNSVIESSSAQQQNLEPFISKAEVGETDKPVPGETETSNSAEQESVETTQPQVEQEQSKTPVEQIQIPTQEQLLDVANESLKSPISTQQSAAKTSESETAASIDVATQPESSRQLESTQIKPKEGHQSSEISNTESIIQSTQPNDTSFDEPNETQEEPQQVVKIPVAAAPDESPVSNDTAPSEETQEDNCVLLEFETIDPSEINFPLTRASVDEDIPTIPSQANVAEPMEVEFIPTAESKSVPPIQKPTESPLQVSGMAVETQVSQPQEVETLNRVETPEAPSSNLIPSTDPPSSTTSNKHVGVMFSVEFEGPPTASSTEENLPPKLPNLLGETVSPEVLEETKVDEAKKLGESQVSLNGTNSQPTPIKPEEVQSQVQAQPVLPSSAEASDETGQRDRDAIITAVKGILDALAADQTSSTIQSESLPKSDSEKVQRPEEELEKGKASLETPKGPKEESKSTPKKPSGLKSQKSVEKEVKFQLPEDHPHHSEDEEEAEEEEVVRPPTPPRTLSKKSKHKSQTPCEPDAPHEVIKYAQVLSGNIVEQSAAAAIAAAKAQSAGGGGGGGHTKETVSVVGFEETAELESGGKWGDRTPTPTFRMATPPVPHRPPTPPADIPSIFLEGPLPISGQQFMVSDSQVEMEGGGDDDDDDNFAAPIVLSGKVTLSVISGLGVDDITEASSLSYDDRAQAGASSKKAIKTEKGLSSSKKSPVSSPDMDEYEVIKAGGMDYEDDDNDDVDITSYMTAEADVDGQKVQEDTAGDISEIDGLGKQDDLPQDIRKDEE